MADVSLPKGHLEIGEALQDATLREVLEETGYVVTISNFVCESAYQYKSGKNLNYCRVFWFSAEVKKGVSRVEPVDPDEIAGVKWVGVEEAARTLTYDNERDVLLRAITQWIT